MFTALASVLFVAVAASASFAGTNVPINMPSNTNSPHAAIVQTGVQNENVGGYGHGYGLGGYAGYGGYGGLGGVYPVAGHVAPIAAVPAYGGLGGYGGYGGHDTNVPINIPSNTNSPGALIAQHNVQNQRTGWGY